MATLTKAINKSLFDSILPSFGNPRVHIPIWDNSQKMFICDEYESGNGHRYYLGIRFCDRIVIQIPKWTHHNLIISKGLSLSTQSHQTHQCHHHYFLSHISAFYFHAAKIDYLPISSKQKPITRLVKNIILPLIAHVFKDSCKFAM